MLSSSSGIGRVSDGEIMKMLWKGEVPIVVNYSSASMNEMKVFPLYDVFPRISYISFLKDKVIEHFSQFGQKLEPKACWFNSCGVDLKSEMPFGPLYDLLSFTISDSEGKVGSVLDVSLQSGDNLLHKFPVEKVMRISGEKDVQVHFLNTLKQGMFLKYGDAKNIMKMSAYTQEKMFNAVKGGVFSEFSEVLESLEPSIKKENINYPTIVVSLDKIRMEIKTKLLILSSNVIQEMTLDDFKKENGYQGDLIVHGIVPDTSCPLLWLLKQCEYPDGHNYFVISPPALTE